MSNNAGKKVKVHYVGTLDDGTQFDSSRDRNEPLGFTCMAGQMIPGFDTAVSTMEIGEVRDVHIEAKDAYGEKDPDMVKTIPLSVMKGIEKFSVGDKVVLSDPAGHPFPATITDMSDETVTFDLNHELAGQALNFNIELLEVEE
ncbi:MAG: FKBP-type peptidyl-prolyl cis-trans isomerase [Olsenella sp.]